MVYWWRKALNLPLFLSDICRKLGSVDEGQMAKKFIEKRLKTAICSYILSFYMGELLLNHLW